MRQILGACFRLHPHGVEFSMKSSLMLGFLPVRRPHQQKRPRKLADLHAAGCTSIVLVIKVRNEHKQYSEVKSCAST